MGRVDQAAAPGRLGGRRSRRRPRARSLREGLHGWHRPARLPPRPCPSRPGECAGISARLQQVAEIERITGFSDGQLAAAFPGGLTRETVNRWRNRPNPNLREENLYRLGLLYELAQRLEEAHIEGRAWLHQAGEEGETPYALICQGRLGDVRRAVDAIAAGALSSITPMPASRAYREHDLVVEEEDEGEWVSWGPDGDTEE
jgi:hypothetical protein